MLYSIEKTASSLRNGLPVKIMLAGTHSGISIVNGKLNYPISGYPSTQFEIGNEVLMITFAPIRIP